MPSVSLFGLAGNFLSIYILHHREVKLKKDFVDVLCMLATFDNLLLVTTFFLFSLPTLSVTWENQLFPYTSPYLYPLTNTFMTASGYMTAAVAVNRYLDISGGVIGGHAGKRLNGYLQATLVLALSAAINVPRWLEFEHGFKIETINKIDNQTGEIMEFNISTLNVGATSLRKDENYIRDYTLISSTVLIVILPTLIMLVSSYLIYRKMKANAKSMASFNASQDQARKRRNRSITLVLVGIIALFLVCHTGEVAVSIYELTDVLDGDGRSEFPAWASALMQINHLLIVMNSSLNFVIYCKDMVFRRVFMMTYHALRCGKSSALSTQVQLSNIKKELGDVGEEENGHQRCPEVVVHESNLGNIDAQSQILCGIAKV